MSAPFFQPRFGQAGYPISRFIAERARALGLSRRDLAGRLGYRGPGKSHKALNAALTTGAVPPHMRAHLADALEISDALLDAVMAATVRQQEDEWRAKLLAREK